MPPFPKPQSQQTGPTADINALVSNDAIKSWYQAMLDQLNEVRLPEGFGALGDEAPKLGGLGDVVGGAVNSFLPDDSPEALMTNVTGPMSVPALGMARIAKGVAAEAAPKLKVAVGAKKIAEGPAAFRRLKNLMKEHGGFSVNPTTGEIPTTGTMVALYPNADKRVSVLPKGKFSEKAVTEYTEKMQPQLKGKDRYLGGWESEGKTYLDVPARVVREPKVKLDKAGNPIPEPVAVRARRIERQERAAIVRGGGKTRTHPDPAVRRAGAQEGVYTLDAPDIEGAVKEFTKRTGAAPTEAELKDITADLWRRKDRAVGDWRGYIDSPTFERRAIEQADAGLRYLQDKGVTNPEWWKLKGTTWERLYADRPDGTMSDDRMKQVAGALAATAPNAGTTENVRQATEYLRRILKNEPVVQPSWRAEPGVNVTHLSEGSMMPMEVNRAKNLELAAAGRGEEMQADKVREEFKALMGDPDAEVLDTHFAKIAEVPESGVYVNTAPGKIAGKEYTVMADRLRGIAKKLGRDPRDWTAEVWTGIRENVKKYGELYGQKFKKAEGESYGYDQILDREIEHTAKTLGLEPQEVERRIRAGDMNLLAALLSVGGIGAMTFAGEQAPPPGA
jgi:hypothetical protein